jgi:transcriptional/translational regulatory protein YebC/TACO1
MWQLVKTEGSLETGDGVTMTFTSDGKLVYVIHQRQSDQIMNLVFSVDGDYIVTNQPSSPRPESTKFWFDDEGQLVLDYGGSKAWFARA